VGHAVQVLVLNYGDTWRIFGSCAAGPDASPESCVVPGVYAMVGAGATMCVFTRLSVTLAVILFELSGSLEHVLPFALGVLVAKWTADAMEPLSIYDLLTDMNSYPFLDNKVRPIFDAELADITSRPRSIRVIDTTASGRIAASELRRKLSHLHLAGELDGGLPIIRNGVLIGLIAAPDLEFALDRLGSAEDVVDCLVEPNVRRLPEREDEVVDDGEAGESGVHDPSDLSAFVDPSPLALDANSPVDLVYECFVKLGLRYICVLRNGKFAGMVHKKAFVQYIKTLETAER